MAWVAAWVWPVALLVLYVIERRDRNQQDRQIVETIDQFDRLAAAMLKDDPWRELDEAWCAEFDMDWSGSAPSSMRLHRGF